MSDDWPDDPKARPDEIARDFARVVGRFQHPLASYLFQFVADRETARDLTQEVFVKVHRSLGGYDPTRRFSTWLFAIAANHARDHLRRQRMPLAPLHEADAMISPGPAPDTALHHGDLRTALDGALAGLAVEDREIVVLHHVAELPIDEIAAALGITSNAAKTRLFRARQRLRHLLESQPS